MARPEVKFDMSLNDDRKRRASLTVEDIEKATGDPTPKPAAAPNPRQDAQSERPGREPQKAPRKQKAVQHAEKSTRMISFRLANEARAELERVSQMHSQSAPFVIKKLIDQWLAKSQEKREEILNK